jgi:hypothetical protein
VLLRTDPAHLYDIATQQAYQNGQGWHLTNTCFFYHPSYEALLYAPLSLLPYTTAYFVYMGWNLLLLGTAVYLAPRVAPAGKQAAPLLFFTAFPVLLCLLEGQNSILFLVALLWVWRHIEAGANWRAGALLGMTLFKPALAAPLAVLLTVRLGKRFLAGFAATGSAVMLLSLWLTGGQGMREFVQLASRASPLLDGASNSARAISVYRDEMPNLEGLLYLGGGRFLTAHGAAILSIAGSAMVLMAAVYMVRRARLETAFCLAIAFAVLLSHHLFLYDHTALLLPMLFLAVPGTRYVRLGTQVFPYVVFAVMGLRLAIVGLVPVLLIGLLAYEQARERKRGVQGSGVAAVIADEDPLSGYA